MQLAHCIRFGVPPKSPSEHFPSINRTQVM